VSRRRARPGPSGRAAELTQRVAPFVVAGLAVIAFSLVIIATRRGPGVSNDSVNYLTGAANLASGKGYVDWLGYAITVLPPGLSLTARLIAATGLDPLDSIRLLNAAAFGALVILAFVLSRRYVAQTWLSVVVAGATCFAPSLMVDSSYAWSEPIFCVLVVGQLLVLDTLATRRSSTVHLLVFAGLIAGVAFLYRYAGLVVLLLSVAVIAATAREDGRRRASGRVATFSVMALVIPGMVVARNLHHGVGPMGDRGPSSETPGHVLDTLVDGLGAWVLDTTTSLSVRPAAVIAMFGVVALAGLHAFRTHQLRQGPVIPAAFVGVYLAFVVGSELVTSLDPIDGRLLSPAFVPAAVTGAWTIESLLSNRNWSGALLVWTSAAVLMVGGIAVNGLSAVKQARALGDRGADYASVEWKSSSIVQAVSDLPEGAMVYSNEPAAIYYMTGRLARWPTEIHKLPRPSYVVSFVTGDSLTTLLQRDDLTIDTVAKFDNGFIDRISSKSG
jgi:hypothetical protein